jgi:pimeloyl-ACP methyl ester carboxylesterase
MPVAAAEPSRTASVADRVASTLALPAAPLYGAFLSYAIYHPPRRRHKKAPTDVGLEAQELELMVARRKKLKLWLVPGSRDRVVVMAHGIGLNASASLSHAKLLRDAGYTVCLFDLRNHGLSDQDRSWWGISGRFTTDVAQVVDHLRAEHGYGQARFAVYGFSFSSFPTFFVLTRADCHVDAVICDSGPADDIKALLRGFIGTGGLPIPGPLRTGVSRRVLEQSFAFFGRAVLQAEWPPAAKGRFADTPSLFVAGERDAIIPAALVARLGSLYPRAEVEVLAGVAHLDGLKVSGEQYARMVLGFLERALGARTEPDLQ